jgi:polar amino acid transport system substrate-binding protein
MCEITAGFGPGAPYNYPDADGKNIGIDADILRIGLEDIGCNVKYTPLPWKRILSDVENGKLDATMSASYKDDRAQFAYYSVPYRAQPHVIMFNKTFPVKATSLSEYLESGYTLGVVLGWHYTNKIQELISSARYKKQIFIAPDYENLLKMYGHKRFFGFLSNPSMLAGVIGKESILREYQMIRADVDILHFLFSRKSVSLEVVQRFNDNLKTRMNLGFFTDICAKYENQLISNCEFLNIQLND